MDEFLICYKAHKITLESMTEAEKKAGCNRLESLRIEHRSKVVISELDLSFNYLKHLDIFDIKTSYQVNLLRLNNASVNLEEGFNKTNFSNNSIFTLEMKNSRFLNDEIWTNFLQFNLTNLILDADICHENLTFLLMQNITQVQIHIVGKIDNCQGMGVYSGSDLLTITKLPLRKDEDEYDDEEGSTYIFENGNPSVVPSITINNDGSIKQETTDHRHESLSDDHIECLKAMGRMKKRSAPEAHSTIDAI
ncbi:unnamed protein product [Brachionus calyciflorus]|uniref:Uncharacterized protein n=1 Tax=Brachionus calyciflorus TaxID=104777 RepID=A0A814DWY5_9BILA|nr:unnamed protein product [Brachionus calyciflorus]